VTNIRPDQPFRPRVHDSLPDTATQPQLPVCSLWNHPSRKAEIRCEVNGDLRESHADNDGLALLDLAERWQQQFQEKEWT
jgi:hypothetical protein